MKRIFVLTAAFAMSAAGASLAQPDATTDVDATTTAEQQSPLAPEQAQTTPPRPQSIEDLLSGTAPYEPPPAPPEQAAPEQQPVSVVTVTPPPAYAPQVPAPPRMPVFIDDRDATPDAPPTATDQAYERRVLGVFHSAQGKQGALDGRWKVESGTLALYTLQFSDPGAGEGRVEGAWRNLRNSSAFSSGFVEEVTRENDVVVVRFIDVSDRRTELRLTPTLAGGWIGEAVSDQGRVPVVMLRDQGVETAAFAVPAYTPPPPPPPPKAKPAPARKKVTAKKSRKPVARSRARAKKK